MSHITRQNRPSGSLNQLFTTSLRTNTNKNKRTHSAQTNVLPICIRHFSFCLQDFAWLAPPTPLGINCFAFFLLKKCLKTTRILKKTQKYNINKNLIFKKKSPAAK